MSFVENWERIIVDLSRDVELPGHCAKWSIYGHELLARNQTLALGVFIPPNYDVEDISALRYNVSSAIDELRATNDTRMSYRLADDYLLVRRESHKITRDSKNNLPDYDIALMAILSNSRLEDILERPESWAKEIPEWDQEYGAFKLTTSLIKPTLAQRFGLYLRSMLLPR